MLQLPQRLLPPTGFVVGDEECLAETVQQFARPLILQRNGFPPFEQRENPRWLNPPDRDVFAVKFIQQAIIERKVGMGLNREDGRLPAKIW